MASRSVLIPYDKYQRLLNQSSASSSQPTIPTLKSVLCPFCKLSLSRKDVMLRHVRNKHGRDLLWETRQKSPTLDLPPPPPPAAHRSPPPPQSLIINKGSSPPPPPQGRRSISPVTQREMPPPSLSPVQNQQEIPPPPLPKKEETNRPYDHSAKTIMDFLLSDCPSLFFPKKYLY